MSPHKFPNAAAQGAVGGPQSGPRKSKSCENDNDYKMALRLMKEHLVCAPLRRPVKNRWKSTNRPFASGAACPGLRRQALESGPSIGPSKVGGPLNMRNVQI